MDKREMLQKLIHVRITVATAEKGILEVIEFEPNPVLRVDLYKSLTSLFSAFDTLTPVVESYFARLEFQKEF